MSSKFELKLSKPVFDLVNIYVLSCELPVIISVLNSSIQYTAADPVFNSGTNILLPGYSFQGESVSVSESDPLTTSSLHVPGYCFSRNQNLLLNSPANLSDSAIHEVVDNLVFPQAVVREHKRRKLQAINNDSEKKKVSTDTAPSVVFATVANAYGEMLCIDVSKDMSQTACGFRDSVVRIYNTEVGVHSNSASSNISEVLPSSKASSRVTGATSAPSGNLSKILVIPEFSILLCRTIWRRIK